VSNPSNTADYVATLFESPSADFQILGATTAGLVNSMHREDYIDVLRKHGLETIEADQWYPLQLSLDIYKDIYEKRENVGLDFVAIGKATVSAAPMPPEIQTIYQAMEFMNVITYASCRNYPPAWGFKIKNIPTSYKNGESLEIICNMPFPRDVVYGYVHGIANRFKPEDSICTVEIVDATGDNEPFPPKFRVTWYPEE